MKKNRFTEAQIIKVLKDQEAGKDMGEICREMGIHKATLYNWKKKYDSRFVGVRSDLSCRSHLPCFTGVQDGLLLQIPEG